VLDLNGAVLDPFHVAVMRGEARQVLGPAQEAQQHADAIVQEGRIGRGVDRHGHHRAVDAHAAACLHVTRRRLAASADFEGAGPKLPTMRSA